MKKKTLSSLSSLVREFPFEYGEVELNLKIDVDALTDDYYRRIGKLQSSKLKLDENPVLDDAAPTEATDGEVKQLSPQEELENSKKTIENIYNSTADILSNKKKTHITLLLCGDEVSEHSLLKGWDATDDEGTPVVLSFETLQPLSPKFVEKLWEFCAEQASGVKKS